MRCPIMTLVLSLLASSPAGAAPDASTSTPPAVDAGAPAEAPPADAGVPSTLAGTAAPLPVSASGTPTDSGVGTDAGRLAVPAETQALIRAVLAAPETADFLRKTGDPSVPVETKIAYLGSGLLMGLLVGGLVMGLVRR